MNNDVMGELSYVETIEKQKVVIAELYDLLDDVLLYGCHTHDGKHVRVSADIWNNIVARREALE